METKYVVYEGETVKGQLEKGKPYAVDREFQEFLWLKTDLGGIYRVSKYEVKWHHTDLGLQPNGKGLEFGKPKPKVTVSEEQIDAAISANEIYRRVRAELNAPQREQVGYGIQKYPELLNADTWTILETIKHIKGELIDGLHYLTMLEIKFEQFGEKDLPK